MKAKEFSHVIAVGVASVILGGRGLAQNSGAAGHGGAGPGAAGGPMAHTVDGPVRGYDDGPVKVFKGIPYAATTSGAGRWLPPRAPAPWTEVRDATQPGCMSPQQVGAPLPEETAMLQKGPMGEDCLNLNVFTPAVGPRSGKRPVMVWFHGGGLFSGSANATSYDGRNLVQKNDVVLVAVSHRLNVLGFLYLADLYGPDYAESGNAGLLDMVAALEWVKRNIAEFGGDPGNVTIFGQSGGGAKVCLLMAMPAARGLFQRAIAQSGAAVRVSTRQEAAANAARLVRELEVKTLAELQALPAERLLQAMATLRFQSSAVVDGRSLPAQPFDPAAPALSRDIPFMVGTTETEATFMPNVPLDPIDDARLRELVTALTRGSAEEVDGLIGVFRRAYPGKDDTYLYQLLQSQMTFQEGSLTVAERKAEQGGAPVYVYYFAAHTPVREGRLRAPHTLEIPFVFDSLAQSAPIVGPPTPAAQALADRVSATWSAFARTGDPNNPTMPRWPAFTTASRDLMIIDQAPHAARDPLGATRRAIAEFRARHATGVP